MTKRPLLPAILALAAAAGALAPHPAIAQTGAPAGGTPTPQREATPEEPQKGTAVVYRPPLRGAPGGRVGGGPTPGGDARPRRAVVRRGRCRLRQQSGGPARRPRSADGTGRAQRGGTPRPRHGRNSLMGRSRQPGMDATISPPASSIRSQ